MSSDQTGSYRLKPALDVGMSGVRPAVGWREICRTLESSLPPRGRGPLIAADCYQGVDIDAAVTALREHLKPALLLDTRSLFHEETYLRRLLSPELTDDPVFGFISRLTIEEFFDPALLGSARSVLEKSQGLKVVAGYAAAFVAEEADLVLYLDVPRREIQLRQRLHLEGNLGFSNREEDSKALYKQSFFVDWRVLDRWKQGVLPKADFIASAADAAAPAMIPARSFFDALERAAHRPFELRPFFDPGVWGGQWMKERFGLDESAPNYAWCFNCVPEEQGVAFRFGTREMLFPAIDLVFFKPRELLGDPVHARFGREFPIRFDFLDTMGGQNLSFQVHPLTEYIQERFGMHYTQDESYYILDAKPGARVFLGLKDGVDAEAMRDDLFEAQRAGTGFPAERYVQEWPAKKHDHFLIPAGTPHCSGADCLVLEVSATPYIFTFKLWDWGRLDLDGRPRPIHLDHGLPNIQWERTTGWVRQHLVNRIERVAEGEGWEEERTGLHEREFIETRRLWFSRPVVRDTGGIERGSVHVLSLIEGEEAIIESPQGCFEPFVVHYAETVIIPAAVGRYTVRPHGASAGGRCATLTAYVRR